MLPMMVIMEESDAFILQNNIYIFPQILSTLTDIKCQSSHFLIFTGELIRDV